MFCSGRRGWRGGEWMRGLGLGFTNSVQTGGMMDVCLYCSGVSAVWIPKIVFTSFIL